MNREDQLAGAMAAVDAALAAQPFRAAPDFADVRVAIEAALRFLIEGPQEQPDADAEPSTPAAI